jgi:hypothetical protein
MDYRPSYVTEALSAIEYETSRYSRDRDSRNSTPYTSVIGKRKLSLMTAIRARWLLRGGWKNYKLVRERIMSEVPATSDPLTADSLTHRLAAHFPRLPVCDYMITGGGPELNQRWVWVIMRDMLERFNTWAETSGFQQEFLRVVEASYDVEQEFFRVAKARENPVIMIGDIELSYRGPYIIGGLVVALKDKAGNMLSFAEYPDSRVHKFMKASHDSTLNGAVEMMEAFMKTWTQPLAKAA